MNEALHNTFDGEFNQHTLSTQDELAEFQATWFPLTDTNLSEYKLEVNISPKPKLTTNLEDSQEMNHRIKRLSKKKEDRHPRDRGNSFSFIAGEKFSPLAEIPDEILLCIFVYLDVHELRNVYRVSKKNIIKEEKFVFFNIFF